MERSAILSVFVTILAITMQETSGAMTMPQLKQAAAMIRRTCQPKAGVATDLLDLLDKGVFTDDRNLKCYLKCAMGMMQAMSPSGKLRPDSAVAQAKMLLPVEIRDRTISAMEKCRSVGQENDGMEGCELAFIVTKCVYEADKEVFFFP